jgi:hypothetical protein
MSIRQITDENDMSVDRTTLREEEGAHVPIIIKGLNLSDENMARIESQVRQKITPELVKHEQARSQRARINNKPLGDKGEINVSLKGLNLADEDTERIEYEIQQIVTEMVAKDEQYAEQKGSVSQPLAGCICAGDIPGISQSLAEVDPLPAPVAGKIVIALFLNILPPWIDSNVLRMVIEDGAPFNLNPTQMLVGLATAVDWAKEITAWSICHGKLSTVYSEHFNGTPTFMLLSKGCAGADTILFSKQKAFGIWGTPYNLDPPRFWKLLGGKRVTFTWIAD